jgi:hypothetical protein
MMASTGRTAPPDPYPLPVMRHPRAFLLITSAALTLGCALGAASLRPTADGRGTAAGFAWFASMAGAGVALTLATAADAATPASRRR